MERQKNNQVDPSVEQEFIDAMRNTPVRLRPSCPSAYLQNGKPIEAEYTRLLDAYRSLEDRVQQRSKKRSLDRILVFLLSIIGVYFSWVCGWVNAQFMSITSAICIAVVAATIGSLWEKRRSKEVTTYDPEATR